MQPTMHRPQWEHPNDDPSDDRGGIGAIIALIAIVVIALALFSLGEDATGETGPSPDEPAITEPMAPVNPGPTTVSP
jgi:hypothetical protein